MTVLFRCRVDPAKLDQAAKVTAQVGTSLPEVFRMFVTQIARTGKIPLSLAAEDNSDLLDVKRRNQTWSELDDTQEW